MTAATRRRPMLLALAAPFALVLAGCLGGGGAGFAGRRRPHSRGSKFPWKTRIGVPAAKRAVHGSRKEIEMTGNPNEIRRRAARAALPLSLALAFVVAGCGGKDEPKAGQQPAPLYGAIACSSSSGGCFGVSRAGSPESAEKQARELCGRGDCKVLAHSHTCGAVAGTAGTGGYMTGETGKTKYEAKYEALVSCLTNSSRRCSIKQWYCN